MTRARLRAIVGASLLAASGAALACTEVSCEVSWSLVGGGFGCQNSIVLSPGNDSRVNLMLLLRDKAGLGAAGKSYPKLDWDTQQFGHNFLDWSQLRESLFPSAEGEDGFSSVSGGSRCDSLTFGDDDFAAAIKANQRVPVAERDLLIAARGRLAKVCAGVKPAGFHMPNEEKPTEVLPDWPQGIASPGGRTFLAYLKAADAFYGERWDEARLGFKALKTAPDPWVSETSGYMLARVDLNASQARAFDEYGFYEGLKKVDGSAVSRAAQDITDYLKAYPQGRYAASARGLVRRTLWLSGNTSQLATTYETLLGTAPATDRGAAELIQEVDNKLLTDNGVAKDKGLPQAKGPMILAAMALMMLREPGNDADDGGSRSARALAAQAPYFSGQPDLYAFLQASQAFHVANDYRRVLDLIPDDAKKPSYLPLAFSRQVLRGMALAALGDRNETGFWLELANGAKEPYQRPTVELGLAMALERRGRISAVFDRNSAVTDGAIRMILLEQSAGVELLRQVARDDSRPAVERNMAFATLLFKQLSRGDYAGFVASRAISVPAANLADDDAYANWNRTAIVKNFVSGTWSSGYNCPALIDTARTLARNPRDIPANLCLGEFWRLNDFDNALAYADHRVGKDELGGAVNQFSGKAAGRAAIYTAVIAERGAAPADKAYALYRAVMCYGPSGYNSCGGEDVEKAQRKSWFMQLKKDYPDSPWAKKLRYYW
jgi:hypothetical protein